MLEQKKELRKRGYFGPFDANSMMSMLGRQVVNFDYICKYTNGEVRHDVVRGARLRPSLHKRGSGVIINLWAYKGDDGYRLESILGNEGDGIEGGTKEDASAKALIWYLDHFAPAVESGPVLTRLK